MQTLPINQLVGHHVGDYRLMRLLGQGQVNAVYLAQSAIQIDPVALTLFLIPAQFSAEERQRILHRFRKEAVNLLALRHPHILPVLDYGEYAGNPCFMTPYSGHSLLADVLKEQGSSQYEYLQNILSQVAAALDTAHSKGVVHGSLKQAHLLLKGKQTVYIAGFGWLNMLQLYGIRQHPQARILSIAGTSLVTPEYTAPEVLAGQPPDTRSDIYALGMILWELLSGARPAMGKPPLDSARQSLHPALPFALESVVKQALDPNPARRFQSASEMVGVFAQAVGMRSEAQPAPQGNTGMIAQDHSTGHWQIVPPIITGKVPAIVRPGNPAILAFPTASAQPLTLAIMKTSTPPTKKAEKQSTSPVSTPDAGPKRDWRKIIVKLATGGVAAGASFVAIQWVAALLHLPHLFGFLSH